jgi:hypothetical protein
VLARLLGVREEDGQWEEEQDRDEDQLAVPPKEGQHGISDWAKSLAF